MFSTSIPIDQQGFIQYLPREILSQIIIECDTLQEVENLYKVGGIVLGEKELNLLSEKFKLPYVIQENGLEYLLKCSLLTQEDIIREFLKQHCKSLEGDQDRLPYD